MQLKRLCLLTLLSACSTHPSSTAMDCSARVGGRSLASAESARLCGAVAALKPKRVEIYDKPKWELVLASGDGGSRDLGVYVDEGAVCEGFYLDLWTDRMEGKPSACLELTRELKKLLEAADESPASSHQR